MKHVLMTLVVFAGTALAQDKPAAPPPPPTILPAQVSRLNEINLELQRLQLLMEKKQLIGEIVQRNPGYHWELNQQSATEGLVPDAAPVAPPPAAKK